MDDSPLLTLDGHLAPKLRVLSPDATLSALFRKTGLLKALEAAAAPRGWFARGDGNACTILPNASTINRSMENEPSAAQLGRTAEPRVLDEFNIPDRGRCA